MVVLYIINNNSYGAILGLKKGMRLVYKYNDDDDYPNLNSKFENSTIK